MPDNIGTVQQPCRCRLAPWLRASIDQQDFRRVADALAAGAKIVPAPRYIGVDQLRVCAVDVDGSQGIIPLPAENAEPLPGVLTYII